MMQSLLIYEWGFVVVIVDVNKEKVDDSWLRRCQEGERCFYCCCGWSGWEEEKDGNNGGYILWMRIVWDGVNNSDQIRRPAHVIITIVADLSFYPNVLNYEMMTYSWLFLSAYPALQVPVLISTLSWLNNDHINVFKHILVQLICTIFVR